MKKKTINTSKKGKGFELEVRKILEAKGYTVETAINKTIFIKGRIISVAHDFFGLWDGMAVKDEEIMFYQVSMWVRLAEKVKKVRESPLAWAKIVPCSIWGRVPGRKPHFKIVHGIKNWEWDGVVEMVLKDSKKAVHQ